MSQSVVKQEWVIKSCVEWEKEWSKAWDIELKTSYIERMLVNGNIARLTWKQKIEAEVDNKYLLFIYREQQALGTIAHKCVCKCRDIYKTTVDEKQ